MNGGDTDTGGAQVNPSTTPINTPGPRPVDAVVPDNDSDADSATTLTISHDDQPSPTLSSLPSTDSATQPSEPTMRPIIPTPSSVSTSQSTPPATNAAPVSSLGTPSTQPSTPVVPPVGMQQPTATPIAPPVSTAQSADQLISQTFASSTSSSQPTIATPVAPLQPSQPTQPLAAPSFSSQPAMQFPAASISSSSDDIILGPPAPSQKSKKGLIIVLIIVGIVILSGLIVGILVSTGKPSQNKQISPEKQPIQDSFNQYANYFLYGEEKSDSSWLETPILEEDTYFAHQTAKGVEDLDMFTKLEKKYSTFSTNIEEDLHVSLGDNGLVDNYGKNLTFIASYYTNTPITIAAILSEYLDKGEEAANEFIKKASEPYKDIGILYDYNVQDVFQKLGEETLRIVILYKQEGCIVDNEIDYICSARYYDNLNKEANDNLSQTSMIINTLVDNSKDSLYYYLFDLNNFINIVIYDTGGENA